MKKIKSFRKPGEVLRPSALQRAEDKRKQLEAENKKKLSDKEKEINSKAKVS